MLIDSETLKRAILTTMPERSEVLLIVDNQPEAVVRCKDCKNYMTIHCTCDGWCISDDWFCADGERK